MGSKFQLNGAEMSVDIMCDNEVKEFQLIVISKSLGKSFGFVYLPVGEMTF